ncbi:MAG: ABC transporter ATP-binding protein [Sorangium cellulosum]|nr:MAG: ABC transporter ATP-binding protein [Sorangium cellulosum]
MGPNGAGKTTTIKILTGLITPSQGHATVLGKKVPSVEARARLGFLPENPYVYPYLTPREFVHMCARLSGCSGANLKDKAHHALKRVGIAYAAERPVKRLSKGMLQRTCLAAALVHEPDLLVLDEPMSGLDPVGRKEVRDVILEEREKGKTVFFSSHILSDVESLCDQVTILRKGEVVVEGMIHDLLQRDGLYTDILLTGEKEELLNLRERLLTIEGVEAKGSGSGLRVSAMGDGAVTLVLSAALEAEVRVGEVVPRRETLEDLFVRRAFSE